MSVSEVARPLKTLAEQIADRRARAEREYADYRIQLVTMRGTLKDGRQVSNVVAMVRRKQPRKAGEPIPCYTVNQFGCSCPDAVKGLENGLKRPCKHSAMVDLFLSAEFAKSEEFFASWQDSAPEPEHIPDEARAEDTLTMLQGGRPDLRERMKQDFPD